MANLLELMDPYEANAARIQRRYPTREPDPASLAASQGKVTWEQFLPSEERARAQSLNALAGENYDPRDVFLSAIGAVGAPAIGPAQGAATLGSGAIRPIRAYHGSPYDFEKFELSKIGTGEGAQAYGHGLYFAENPATAQSYRDALTARNNPADQQMRRFLTGADENAPGQLPPTGLDLHMLPRMGEERASLSNAELLARAHANLKDVQGTKGPLGTAARERAQATIKYLEANPSARFVGSPYEGRMYEVNIHADPAQFLDWDKPLAQQTEAVRSSFRPEALGLKPTGPLGEKGYFGYVDEQGRLIGSAQTGKLPQEPFNPNELGMSLYKGGGSWKPEEATARFREAGIPGIRYLDQGSRNAGGWHITPPDQTASGKWMVKSSDYNSKGLHFDTKAQAETALNEKIGSQTSNYVLFRDDIIDIVKKYGWAGLGLFGISAEDAKAAGVDKPKKDNVKIGNKTYESD